MVLSHILAVVASHCAGEGSCACGPLSPVQSLSSATGLDPSPAHLFLLLFKNPQAITWFLGNSQFRELECYMTFSI